MASEQTAIEELRDGLDMSGGLVELWRIDAAAILSALEADKHYDDTKADLERGTSTATSAEAIIVHQNAKKERRAALRVVYGEDES